LAQQLEFTGPPVPLPKRAVSVHLSPFVTAQLTTSRPLFRWAERLLRHLCDKAPIAEAGLDEVGAAGGER
jgi:hypothetical protein